MNICSFLWHGAESAASNAACSYASSTQPAISRQHSMCALQPIHRAPIRAKQPKPAKSALVFISYIYLCSLINYNCARDDWGASAFVSVWRVYSRIMRVLMLLVSGDTGASIYTRQRQIIYTHSHVCRARVCRCRWNYGRTQTLCAAHAQLKTAKGVRAYTSRSFSSRTVGACALRVTARFGVCVCRRVRDK